MNPKVPAWLVIYALIRSKLSDYHRKGLLAIYSTSYLASIARVLSWAIVAALVYRHQGRDELAVLMLIRGATGLISILPLGIAPGLVYALTQPRTADKTNLNRNNTIATYTSSLTFIGLYALIVLPIAYFYSYYIKHFHQIASKFQVDATLVALCLSLGTMVRGVSEVIAAELLAKRKQVWDNLGVGSSELLFVILFLCLNRQNAMANTGFAFAISSIFLIATRSIFAIGISERNKTSPVQIFSFSALVPIFALGGWVIASQFADWLYAPYNQILMDRFLKSSLIAQYVPAMQIDGALLLLIAGISVSMLPLSAFRYRDRLWRELKISYLRGSIISFLVMALGAVIICSISKWLFLKWFGKPLDETRAILPFVLIHTVIGGTASISRSVLFGMGRMKQYAIAASIGGILNAVLATAVVILKPEWGLMGIIGVTIFTVTLRCGIWLPWYTLHAIRQEESRSPLASA